jgi:hypothetical protein
MLLVKFDTVTRGDQPSTTIVPGVVGAGVGMGVGLPVGLNVGTDVGAGVGGVFMYMS